MYNFVLLKFPYQCATCHKCHKCHVMPIPLLSTMTLLFTDSGIDVLDKSNFHKSELEAPTMTDGCGKYYHTAKHPACTKISKKWQKWHIAWNFFSHASASCKKTPDTACDRSQVQSRCQWHACFAQLCCNCQCCIIT